MSLYVGASFSFMFFPLLLLLRKEEANGLKEVGSCS